MRPGAVEDPGNVKWVLNDQSVDQGFLVTAAVTQQGDKLQVTLTNANWYLRWIGVWLQFLDAGGTPIAVADLPKDTIPGSDSKSNLKDTFFGTMVPPEFTILAIPVDAGYATVTFNMPPAARKVRILGSGLGTGSVDYPDTVVLGSVMTIMFNYGVTTIFLAAGADARRRRRRFKRPLSFRSPVCGRRRWPRSWPPRSKARDCPIPQRGRAWA